MASCCELHLDDPDARLVASVGAAVEQEAARIERKFSRYRNDSVVGRINAAAGRGAVEVDVETALLLDFADHCFDLSDGLFDITSGVLRRIWRFDGSDRVPSDVDIEAVRQHIGWRKVRWKRPMLELPAGMEIDLGGLGKEYAVDCAINIVTGLTRAPALVNFGGDLRATGLHRDGSPWMVAIESVDSEGKAEGVLQLPSGGLATSGDARRFLLKDGVRYGHILDPRTGRPVMGAPRSVTVAAATCTEAGLLATLAMLQGENAEAFLKQESVRAWCIR